MADEGTEDERVASSDPYLDPSEAAADAALPSPAADVPSLASTPPASPKTPKRQPAAEKSNLACMESLKLDNAPHAICCECVVGGRMSFETSRDNRVCKAYKRHTCCVKQRLWCQQGELRCKEELQVKDERDDEVVYTEAEWKEWYALMGWTWDWAEEVAPEPEPEFELVVTSESSDEDARPPPGPVKAKQRPGPKQPSFPPPPPAVVRAADRVLPPPPPRPPQAVSPPPPPPAAMARPPWRSDLPAHPSRPGSTSTRRSTSQSSSSPPARRAAGSDARGQYVPGGHGFQLATGEYSASLCIRVTLQLSMFPLCCITFLLFWLHCNTSHTHQSCFACGQLPVSVW